MTARRLVRTALAAVLAGASVAPAIAFAAAPITSTFDTDEDGWTGITSPIGSPSWPIGSSLAAEFSSTDGQPAGSIRLTDPNDDWTYFRAPSKFLGDLTAYLGGTLSWDSRAVTGGTSANEAEVVLMGAGLVLVYEATATLSDSWTSFSVALGAGPWRVSDTFGGALATPEQVAAVLGNLQELWINAEYYTPVVETIALDNVRIAPVPEPTGAAMLAAGLGLVGWRLARRRMPF